MSTIKVNTIKDTSGTEVYTAKAWVNFNGTGTVAIRAAGNVSSITDNGTGDYTINFTVAMSDGDYSIAINGADTATDAASFFNRKSNIAYGTELPSTSSFRIRTGGNYYTASAYFDIPHINVVVFR